MQKNDFVYKFYSDKHFKNTVLKKYQKKFKGRRSDIEQHNKMIKNMYLSMLYGSIKDNINPTILTLKIKSVKDENSIIL